MEGGGSTWLLLRGVSGESVIGERDPSASGYGKAEKEKRPVSVLRFVVSDKSDKLVWHTLINIDTICKCGKMNKILSI